VNQDSIGNHLDHSAIAAIAGGNSVAPADLDHLSKCETCRRSVSAVAHILSDPDVAAEITRLDPSPARRSTWAIRSAGAIAAVAAVAALAIGVERTQKQQPLSEAAPAMREGVITSSAPPRIVSPVGTSGAGTRLVWTATPDADLYRVRVWTPEGKVAFTSETQDTTLLLPAELQHAGAVYLWEVSARTGWDRWVASDFVQFTVGAKGR
jgi:hypothetical protein